MTNTAPSSQNSKSQPTALVAGGAGFIGSHLVSTLISQNFQVICIDNLSSGKKENLKEILTSPSFTFIEADINNPLSLPEGVKIDYVFHLASVEEDKSRQNFSLDTLLVNSLGTRQLLEIARIQGAKFILTSSADLYSGAISSSSLRYYFGKTPEEEAILSSHEAKRFAEALAFEYHSKFKLPLTLIRLKDAYGPKMNLDRGDTLATLLSQAASGETLIVPGDGLQVVHPTFVSDIVFSLVKAAVGDFSGEIFILVNPEKITLESFAQTVKLVVGPIEIEHKKVKDESLFSVEHFDLSNTKDKLNWQPKVTLAEGIGAVIQNVKLKDQVSVEAKTSVPDRLPEVEESKQPTTQTKTEKKPGQLGKFLRIGLFTVSALLILITVIYPLASVEVNSYLGKQSLDKAIVLSQTAQNDQVVKTSFQAQNLFQDSAASLQNINWLLKMVGLGSKSAELDKTLLASSSYSQALRSVAAANQILLAASENPNLTTAEAEKSLQTTLNNLESASDQIKTTKLLLNSISGQNSLLVVAPDKAFLLKEASELETEINELVGTIEQTLTQPETDL